MAEPAAAAPQRKVVVGGIVSALVAILTWASKAYGHVEVPPEIAVAANGVLSFLASYLVPNATQEPEA